jgi:glycosyltransferase involved in cell wall biosynthesis
VAGVELPDPPAGVRAAGRLTPAQFRGLLGRARAFVTAARREDYGIAALEALACGCQLVTTPSPGPYPALELARALDPRLVSADLAGAIRSALDDPRPDYARRAAELLAPFAPAAVDRTVAERVLPRLVLR